MADSSALDGTDDLNGTTLQQQMHLTSSSSSAKQNQDYCGSAATFIDRGVDQASASSMSQSQLFLEILDQVPLEPTNASKQ